MKLMILSHKISLRQKCPYSGFSCFVFARIWAEYGDTPYLSVFSPNARKYGPEKLRMLTLFT